LADPLLLQAATTGPARRCRSLDAVHTMRVERRRRKRHCSTGRLTETCSARAGGFSQARQPHQPLPHRCRTRRPRQAWVLAGVAGLRPACSTGPMPCSWRVGSQRDSASTACLTQSPRDARARIPGEGRQNGPPALGRRIACMAAPGFRSASIPGTPPSRHTPTSALRQVLPVLQGAVVHLQPFGRVIDAQLLGFSRAPLYQRCPWASKSNTLESHDIQPPRTKGATRWRRRASRVMRAPCLSPG